MQGERLEAICKSRKNKEYVALDKPSAHVSSHQVSSKVSVFLLLRCAFCLSNALIRQFFKRSEHPILDNGSSWAKSIEAGTNVYISKMHLYRQVRMHRGASDR